MRLPMRIRLLPALALLAGLLWPAPGLWAADWQPRPELLVSAEWVAGHAADADAYAEGHLPGAVNLPAERLFTERDGVQGMLPPLPQVAAMIGAAGIGADTTVVLYDDTGGLYASRLFWALDYLGQGRGRLMDGGWPAWQREGRAVTREPAHVAPQRFTPHPRAEAIADLAWMRAHLHDAGTVLVDARSSAEYGGVTRYAKHRGHIPGAVSMEWKRHLRGDGTFRPADALRDEYERLGVTPDREAAVYCQVLVRAAHSYFTLRWLGLPRVRGYDGSWAEWGNRDDTPKALL